MEHEISEEEMQKLLAFPTDAIYGLCHCVNYLYNEIEKLKAKTNKNKGAVKMTASSKSIWKR